MDKKKAFYNVQRLKRMCIDYFGGDCSRCGIRDDISAIYDFHHVGEKESQVSALISRYARRIPVTHIPPQIFSELSKCILVCSNCHRKIHYEMNQEKIAKGITLHPQILGRPRNNDRLNAMRRMRRSGFSVTQIAKTMNCTRQNVYCALEKTKDLPANAAFHNRQVAIANSEDQDDLL